MNRKIRVGVVFGGRSGEHEVSLRSAESVMRAIDRDRFEIIPVGITKEGRWVTGPDPLALLQKSVDTRLLGHSGTPFPDPEPDREGGCSALKPSGTLMPGETILEPVDVFFPVVHGPFGEDGTLQGLLEMAQTAYVGCGVLASSVAMDKILFKDVMTAHGIRTVPYRSALRRAISTAPDEVAGTIEKAFGYPVFCKPANLGSSVGISKCHDREELIRGLRDAADYDRRVLIEMAVPNAREIEVSVLGNDEPRASVPGEIIPSREFYDYQAKYLDEGDQASRLIIPARLDPSKEQLCKDLAVQAFKAVDGCGMARVDFLLDHKTGDLYLNEINTIPGFTSISMYPKLWEASGISYPELITMLIDLALERFEERQSIRIDYSPE